MQSKLPLKLAATYEDSRAYLEDLELFEFGASNKEAHGGSHGGEAHELESEAVNVVIRRTLFCYVLTHHRGTRSI